MADRAATVVIKNMSTAVFFKDGAGFRDGEGTWTRDLLPPYRIPSGSVAEPGYAAWRGENSAVLGAPVLGWAIYHLDDNQTKLNINFESASGAIKITAGLEGPAKDNYTVEYFSTQESMATQVVMIQNKV